MKIELISIIPEILNNKFVRFDNGLRFSHIDF